MLQKRLKFYVSKFAKIHEAVSLKKNQRRIMARWTLENNKKGNK